ncbi:hypothetical protein HGRIS_000303 [Hohenbuehelia grisea]|uniref:FAD dependent oxidoreductase domain-containing protein n=1 Tax=Hohenbuehelia grisea TaxID=104357 RepID=A0ABR3JSI1_9AGAR
MAAINHNDLNRKHVVVLGAGVVGLTTAIQLQEVGDYKVTIVADILPSDPKDIRYTSQWAGGHHVSLAGNNERQAKWDRDTFDVMWDLSKPGGDAEGCFMRLPQTEFFDPNTNKSSALAHMPDFQSVAKDDLVPGSDAGVTFSTVTIDVPKYLNYLAARFLGRGGTLLRGSVQHISQIIEGGPRACIPSPRTTTVPDVVDALVVCVGLGARSLGGVEDSNVYPIRGQTVLLRAPWVKIGCTIAKPTSDGGAIWTYIIPRRSGDVIVGGTLEPNDWYPVPRPETTEDILKRTLALCPELAPPEARANGRQPTVADLRPLIIEGGCGLRPGRQGGIRVELEWYSRGDGQGRTPVIHNYGHAGYGYISSWGTATEAMELVVAALRRPRL